MEYKIEQVKTDEKSLQEVLSLLQISFPNSTKFSLEYLKWQYADNPNGEIVGFNAYWGEELAAHYVTMPIYMNINGQRTKGLLSLNTATHPNHRGKRLFSILADRTYNYAQSVDYKFVIGVANANSTHGFIKNLGFSLIGPLTFRVGFGVKIFQNKDFQFTICWDNNVLQWRLNNPANKYYNYKGFIVSPIKIGAKTLLGYKTDKLEKSNMSLRPLNLYIGLGADLSKGHYFKLPKFIKHSPFNLIFRDLTNGTLPKVTKDNIFFQLLDFDVA
ncbi:MAG: GNAT family N-acetyltransferase [Bacteroidota bacterium]|nr:GNAT family N-acetyltransferase [Bacteroidota bacterium]